MKRFGVQRQRVSFLTPLRHLHIDFLACFLLIAPVYRYNRVNAHILDGFRSARRLLFTFLTYWIVRPILYVYALAKYLLLARWRHPLARWLESCRGNVAATLDRLVLQRVRELAAKCGQIARYWLYFYWLNDLRSFTYRTIGVPILNQLRVVGDYFVYVFGGYWFAPLAKQAGR